MTKITNSKTILGGKPRISGTRISVDVVANYLTHGYGIKEIRADYPHLSKNQIVVALKYLEKKASTERKILEPAAN